MNRLSTRPRRAAGSHRSGVCLLAGAALGMGGVCGSTTARADDISWSNTNGGIFNVGTNWIGGVVPGTASRAVFSRWRPGNPQPVYTVSFSTDPTNQAVVAGGDNVTFDLNGHAYLLTDAATAITVGTAAGSSGRFTIMDGVVATTAANPTAKIGTNGVSGFLTVSTGGQLLGPEIIVGSTGPGTLTIQNGGDFVGRNLQLSGLSGFFSGAAAVTGAGSVAVVENLIVGVAGSGSLSITGGGRVECTSASLATISSGVGTANVDGVNSRCTSSGELTIGSAGTGTLNITNGGLVECTVAGVGRGLSGVGTLLVNGVNSRLLCSNNLLVGNSGHGTMTVTGGGRVECTTGMVGNPVGTAPTVTVGGNSQWIMSGGLAVGLQGGVSELNIGGGSLVQCSGAGIGSLSSVGIVNVDGAGTRWLNSGSLTIGVGDGTLNITGGGLVTCAGGRIASFPGTTSTLVSVSGAGSRLTIAGDVSVGGEIDQNANIGPGTLDIGPGGTASADSIFIYPEGVVALRGGTLDASSIVRTFSSDGLLSFQSGTLHVGVVHFSLLNQGGTLAPGHSAGSTSINGSYTQQAAGSLEIEIGGAAPGTQFDQVAVGGPASLAGTLNLRLINGFVPSPAQTFVVLDASGITGAFANAASGQRVAVSSGGGSFVVHYGPGSPFDPTTITLSGFGPCPSDFNGDGFLDFFDADAFVACFEGLECPPGRDADFNDDGFVDFFDADAFVDAFEAGC